MTITNSDFIQAHRKITKDDSVDLEKKDYDLFKIWENFNELEAGYFATLDHAQHDPADVGGDQDEWEPFKKNIFESLGKPEGPLSRAFTSSGKALIITDFLLAGLKEWKRLSDLTRYGRRWRLGKRSLKKRADTYLIGMFWSLVKPNNPVREKPLTKKEAIEFLVIELGPSPFVGGLNYESLRKKIERLENAYRPGNSLRIIRRKNGKQNVLEFG